MLFNEVPLFLDCPVVLLLAVAFAFNAFEYIKSPEDLLSHPVPTEEDDFFEIPWKQSILHKPIFVIPKLVGKDESKQRPMKTDHIRDYLALLSTRAGFQVPITPYDMRRYFANNLHEANVGGAHIQQIMGHKSEKTFRKFYQSRITTINTQNLSDEQGREIQNLAKNLRRVPKFPAKTSCFSDGPKNQLTLIPESIERFGDLRDPKIQAEAFYRLYPARRVVRRAAEAETFSIWKSVEVLEALIDLAQNRNDSILPEM